MHRSCVLKIHVGPQSSLVYVPAGHLMFPDTAIKLTGRLIGVGVISVFQ